MKVWFSIFLFLLASLCFSQGKSVSFSAIDWKAGTIDATSPDTLAQLLTAPYTTELDKVRSIFRWITGHIAYNVIPPNPNPYKLYRLAEPEDTSATLKPLNERIANIVLRRRVAVCDGYSRLFKTLCDFAGIKSEVITGYARTGASRHFKSNHKWNAVYIDSTWYLLDATWASGYINYKDEFVKNYDDSYFLTPPEDFIRDHYPEELQWTLMAQPPLLKEFAQAPFENTAFYKHNITSYKPANGIINASVGDSIVVELEINNVPKKLRVADTLYIDSTTFFALPVSAHQSPAYNVAGNKIFSTYYVTSHTPEWLQVVYNDEVILRYKLNIKKNPDLQMNNNVAAVNDIQIINLLPVVALYHFVL